MKLLTFLGMGKYEKVFYQWQDFKPFETKFFSQALVNWLEPEAVYLLRTPETQKASQHSPGEMSNWEKISEVMGDQLIPIDIPNGHNETDLWQIFEAMTKCFEPGDRVVIDVTHAFRSLPILAVMAITYLRQVKNIKLEKIVYGAYGAHGAHEASKIIDGKIIYPTFDLTPFVELLDWTHAAHQFMETGQALELSNLLTKQFDLLKDAQSNLFRVGLKPDKPLPKTLKLTAIQLQDITDALMLSRPQALSKASKKFQENVKYLRENPEDLPKPFQVILEQTAERYAGFDLNNLATERDLIVWYHKHGHWVQALTLMREWMVSLLCVECGWDRINEREKAEKSLNVAKHSPQSPLEFLSVKPTQWEKYLDIWEIADNRNDVAHFGQRKSPLSAGTIKQKIEEGLELICELDLPD